jgi:hypothetical protein
VQRGTEASLILAFFAQEQLSILELELGQAREQQEHFRDLAQALSNENEKLKGRNSVYGQIQSVILAHCRRNEAQL